MGLNNMLHRLRRHASYANVVASVALFLALGGVSYAAFHLPANSVGTAQIKNRAVTLAKVSAGAQRTLRTGLPLFARVDETGALHQHSPGVLASKDASFPGLYHVTFTQDISGCAAVVSQGESSNGGFYPDAQYVAEVQSDGSFGGGPHLINVYPTDASGSPVSAGFDLIVAC